MQRISYTAEMEAALDAVALGNSLYEIAVQNIWRMLNKR